MRTKLTGVAKKEGKVNKKLGTPTTDGTEDVKDAPSTSKKPRTPKRTLAAETQPSQVKTPTAQPEQLSEQDRERLKGWLEQNAKPFHIVTAPLSRKRKRSGQAFDVQTDLFDERLAVQYEVKPRDMWESLRRYKKFTVGNESIATGQCILVKHDDKEERDVDMAAQWKAKVLEVRALSSEHVYIRVAWLNRPEDLRSGRLKHHGKHELIPTNQMDVIDAMAVNGPLDVTHWDEGSEEDDSGMPDEDQYFWRQTLDFAYTGKLSELRNICIDKAPQNPDEMILRCSNVECLQWNHVGCIAEDAVSRATGSTPKTKKATPKKKGGLANVISIREDSSAVVKAANKAGDIAAEVFVEGEPKRRGVEAAKKDEIVVTDANGERRSESICCLFCRTEIE